MKAGPLSVMISSSAPQWQRISSNMNAPMVLLFYFWSFRCSRYDNKEHLAWMIYQYLEAQGMFMMSMWALWNSEVGAVTVGGM
jgi:hypothetical protein